ncbi:MAG TPA: tetratricopeptide repeat protein [Thermoanaerobaculia bacterium]|jgi:tetratricopeptide (TPR) repeat protein|nr:tetratricopeptide repeat protein [Thermoanaerobaculia bacterium]
MIQVESDPRHDGRAPALAPGRVLASRYRIVSFLGRGAVGEVYEAEDQELGDRIAIKILRPEIAGDERVLQRFKREIQLARRVTHPNVCRVFDLVRPPEEDGGAFLTMELLLGETLEQRLDREGRMSTAEALPVIGHIAAALSAAHANGVVHRDLKSGNVFLVPTPSGTRAVVTDFGLAWSSIHEDSSATLTATGELVGSPAYMAPEQVRGEEATPATDIYALGVVMFEMITGELPFVGKSAFYTALKRLQEPAPSPRVHLSDLDPAWETTILRCLERDPADRFPTVRHVVRSLGATKAEEDATSPLALLPERTKPSRWWMGLGIAALLTIAAVAGLGIAGRLPFRREAPASRPKAETVAPGKPANAIVLRPSVAVLPFDNLSKPREEPPGLVMFELLPVELAATGKLRVIPPDEVDRVVRDLGAERTMQRLRERLGADFLVSGAFLADGRGEPTRYDVEVRDARTGRRIAALTEPGGAAALDSLGRRLHAVLGAGELSSGNEEALRAALPKPEAARLYAEGLHRLWHFDAPAARDLLQQAADADPEHPLVRSALAAAWRDLGDKQEAQREAKQAFVLATALRREDRLALEARYHEVAREWSGAIANYQEILSAFPDDLETGLRLAAAQTEAGQSAQVEATLERLRRLPAPLGEDPRIDLAEAEDAAKRRDFERQRAAAERAIAKAEARENRVLVAEGRLQQGMALLGLRQLDAGKESFEEAQRAFMEAQHPRGRAEALRGIALVEAMQDRREAASASYAEMIRIFQQIGAGEDVARGLNQMGNLNLDAGDLDQAETIYKQALNVARKIHDPRAEATVLHNLAKLTFGRGRLAEARELFRRILAVDREIGFAEGEGAGLQGLGTISTMNGDLLEARRYFQEALGVYRRIGAEKNIPEVFNNLAEVSFARGELAQCRKEREQARDLARQAHQEHEAARALGGLAAILRQQGDLAGARDLYGQSLASYQQLNASLEQAGIQDEIGLTLTLQGELIEALKQFQDALAGARQGEDREAETRTLTHQSRALLRYGEVQRAFALQQRSVEIARSLQQSGFLAEALLGLGHIQLVQDDLKAARRSFEEALAAYRSRGERSGIASALFGLGEALRAGGELGASRERHEETFAIRTDMGEQLAAAESRLALAEIELAQGRAAQAEAAARRELDAFRKLGNAPGEAASTLLLTRSLLSQGRTAEARKTLQGAARLFDASQEPAVRKAAAELKARTETSGQPS